MDPITISSIALSAIPALGKLFGSGKQKRQAEELAASNNFTPYQLPNEVLQATEMLGNQYRNGMPGMTAAADNIAANASSAFNTGIQGATSGGDVLDLATKVQYGQNQATNALNAEALQFKQNALGDYTNQLRNQAAYRDKEFQYNVADPFNRKANAAAGMYGASQVNKNSALDALTTSALAGATAYSNYKKSGS